MSPTDVLCAERGLFLAATTGGGWLAFGRDGEAGEAAAEMSFDAAGEAVELGGTLIGATRVTPGTARGTLGDAAEPIECAALSVERADADAAPAVRRSISALLAGGGFFALAAARAPGADAHGAEELAAALTSRDETLEISEVLLSTEYAADGTPRRATLELSLAGDEDGIPMRGAGTLLAAARSSDEASRTDTCLFQWAIEGQPGIGRYEVTRRL